MKTLERLQKVLSQAGHGSRRQIEQLIMQGVVRVNGAIAKLGDCVNGNERITINGKIINHKVLKNQLIKKIPRVLLYHKPIGEICTRYDPKHEKTVFEHLPKLINSRWVMVGRLDINTSGLLIFTNNGDLANQMMHPRFGLEREYAVRVYGNVTDQMLINLRNGVQLDDGIAKFKAITLSGGEGINTWYNVIITEGKNREVRRLWKSQGLEVSRLIRIRYGKIFMPRWLARGKFTEFTKQQVESLSSSLIKIK